KVLDNKYPASEIFEFIKGFKLTKTDAKYINTTKYTDFIDALSGILNLPLTNYYLTQRQVKGIQDYKL
ncbi:MAG: transposase, partial [Clostridia bacterium]|nr:transposase [Clostridia bacterium]